MKIFKSFAYASALAITGAGVVLAPAVTAQSRQATATVNLQAAIYQSAAYQAAVPQIQASYKADVDAINARTTVLQTEMKPLVDAYNAAAQAPGATQESVSPAAQALQAKRQSSQQEIARMRQRIDLAEAYVREQIEMQLETAIRTAMKAKKVDIVLQPEAVVIVEPYVDITADVVTQLNGVVPAVNHIPPANYQPGALIRAAQEAQQQQPAQQPSGR